MKVSILAGDLSENCIVRVYPIAKVLEKHYEVEVIGPVFGNEIFKPYQDEFHYKPYFLDGDVRKFLEIAKVVKGIHQIIKSIEGNVIYAFKPVFTSFGTGLLAKYVKKLPLILDIEDWEAESYYRLSVLRRLYLLSKVYNPKNELYNRAMEPLTKLADEITVASSFLQNRYGGVKLLHGADCSYFDPIRYDRKSHRKKWGVNDKKVILFTGMPHPHKGLQILLEALCIINSDSICLMIVGQQKEHLIRLKEKFNHKFIISIGPQPHSKMPEFLSLADLVVLPQRSTSFAKAQVPGKIFEAMAMAKPIIATTVSDLPEILDGCGWIVEPEEPEKLAEAIQYVFNHPEEAEEMGWKAREKCIKKYSWDAMEEILDGVFRKYE